MQLQPSTQSWRVIWVRAGIALQLVERELGRLGDQAADAELVAGEAGVAQRDVVGVARVERAVAAKGLARRRPGSNSCAIAGRGATIFCAARLRCCALFSVSTNDSFCDSRSQPASSADAGGGDRAAQQVAAVALPGAHQGEGLASWPHLLLRVVLRAPRTSR